MNLHFHVLHLDGVYDRGADGSLRFFDVAPRRADVEALVERIGVRCERWRACRRRARRDAAGLVGAAGGDGAEAGEEGEAERLCRYVLRPPLALPRLERFQGVDGRTMVRIERKRTYSDGTHAIELSAPGLAEKLVAIVPPPRVYTVIYSGVLAANAALRPEVIPKVPTSTDAEQTAREARTLKRRDGPTPSLRAQLTLS